MFARIVIPLDGSEAAERAVPDAVELARQLGVPLHLVRVVGDTELMDLSSADREAPSVREWATAAAMAGEYLDHVRARLVERGLAVTTEVRRGEAWRQILAATRAGGLLVIASHGQSWHAHVSLGSVADAVVHRARVPVLIVRAPEEDSAR